MIQLPVVAGLTGEVVGLMAKERICCFPHQIAWHSLFGMAGHGIAHSSIYNVWRSGR